MMVEKNLPLSIFTFCIIFILVTNSHMNVEEKTTMEHSTKNDMKKLQGLLPPISIVELTKTSRRISRMDAEMKKLSKKKVPPRKAPRPLPPANCVPLSASCKPPSPLCCDPCAICHCRLFQTVCLYKMGYPNC
uniref:Agouti-signaling protein n=1 Tax=Andrias davidianus TaxID=141262 RepID=A0A4D6C8B3_ANDDA|nr:agouti [Andrias davidianus]